MPMPSTKPSPGHESVTSDYSSVHLGLSPEHDPLEAASLHDDQLFDELKDLLPLETVSGTSELAGGLDDDLLALLDQNSPPSNSSDPEELVEDDENVPPSPPARHCAGSKPVVTVHADREAMPSRRQVKVVRVVRNTRGRRPMPTPEVVDPDLERSQKNAIQARINRQKKKQYVNGLESDIERLQQENDQLRKDQERALRAKDALADEVAYLKQVLANDSALAAVLGKLAPSEPSVRLSNAYESRKRGAAPTLDDHDYGEPAPKTRRRATGGGGGGVCLHVRQGDVSLEFCHRCAKMADSS